MALAAMAGIASGAACAAPAVTLYGRADAGLLHRTARFNGGTTSVRLSRTGMQSGLHHASRFGMKGQEDLGGGLSARFKFEQEVGLTDGSSDGGFRREAWLGLSSTRWGTVKLGRQMTLPDDFLGISTVRAQGKLSRSFGGGEDASANDMLSYVSPRWSGVQAGLAYARGGADAGETFRHWKGAALRYDHGSWHLAATIDQLTMLDPVTGGSAGYAVRDWILAVRYRLGRIQFSTAYGQDHNGKIKQPADADEATLGGFVPAGLGEYNRRGFRSRNYYLGVSAEWGEHTLGLAWSRSLSNLGQIHAANHGTTPLSDSAQTIVAAQYLYALSRRTLVYVYGARVSGMAYLRGFGEHAFAMGLHHRF